MPRALFNNLVLSGPGSLDLLPSAVGRLGTSCLLVTGASSLKSSGRLDRILSLLRQAGVTDIRTFPVSSEPDTLTVTRCAETGQGAGFVLAVGGGSVLDTAKAAAALLTNPGPIERYLELTPAPEPLRNDPLPVVAAPTTAGTGSESSQNAVITVKERTLKVSIRDPRLLPRSVILDPELIADVPRAVAASAAMDSLTQLVEAYTGRNRNPLLEGLVEDAIRRWGRSVFAYLENPRNNTAASEMQYAAWVSGLALANLGLGAVHALARPIGAAGLPHGLVCAVLLPKITALNASASPDRYGRVFRLLGGEAPSDEEAGRLLPELLAEMNRRLGIPPSLRGLGVALPEADHIIAAAQGGSLRNNPADLDLAAVLADL